MFRMVGVVVAVAVLSVDGGSAQSPGLTGGIVMAPNIARQLTISKDGKLRAIVTIPAGMVLSASYDERRPNSITSGRWEFHGDFLLRGELASELPDRGVGIFARMADAPLVIALHDLDVVIENSK
jgi:hypothetical protein